MVNNKIRLTILLLLIAVAAAEFTIRGPLRAISDSSDFRINYLSSKAWLNGTDPYDHANIAKIWEGVREDENQEINFNLTYPIYPPPTLLLISPFSLVSWPIAKVLITSVSIFLFSLLLLAVFSLSGLHLNRDKALLFIGLAFAMAPFHTAIAKGQFTTIAVAFLVFAFWMAGKGKDALAGVFLAVAICIKPQVSGLFFLYYAFYSRWRICGYAVGVSTIITIASLTPLYANDISWFSGLTDAIAFGEKNGSNNPTASNPIRFHLVNLQYFLHTMVDSRTLVNSVVFTFAGVVTAAYIMILRRSDGKANELLKLSPIAILTLLVVYHRFYDAELLIIPLAWAVSALGGPLAKNAWITLALMAPFLIPGAVALKRFEAMGYIPSSITTGWWWESVIVPHQVWGLTLLLLYLLYTLAKSGDLHGGLQN